MLYQEFLSAIFRICYLGTCHFVNFLLSASIINTAQSATQIEHYWISYKLQLPEILLFHRTSTFGPIDRLMRSDWSIVCALPNPRYTLKEVPMSSGFRGGNGNLSPDPGIILVVVCTSCWYLLCKFRTVGIPNCFCESMFT